MSTRLTINIKGIESAKKFVNETSKFTSNIDIISGRYVCDAKSLLALLSFDLLKPIEVEMYSDDEEEIERFNKIMEEFR